MAMTTLLVTLVLTAPVRTPSHGHGSAGGDAVCSVSVFALDPDGRVLRTPTASASRTPAMVFRGRASQLPEGGPALLLDVFNPRGVRYQTLLAPTRSPSFVLQRAYGPAKGTTEATLAVAGSSIAWTSMYGLWHVVPRFEGQDSPCGRPHSFTIRP